MFHTVLGVFFLFVFLIHVQSRIKILGRLHVFTEKTFRITSVALAQSQVNKKPETEMSH